MNNTTRPLIDLVREYVAADNDQQIAYRRKTELGRTLNAAGLTGQDVGAFVRGYDTRCAEDNMLLTDTRELANKRIESRDSRIEYLETQLRSYEIERDRTTTYTQELEAELAEERRLSHELNESGGSWVRKCSNAEKRIAELEAQLAARPRGTEGRDVYEVLWHAIDMMGDAVGAMTGPGGNCIKIAEHVVARIKELEVQLAQARADEIVAVANADIWQEKLEARLAARSQATGVVVTPDMELRAYEAWRDTPVGGNAFRALCAALTSATTVPLASAEPECWRLGTGDETEFLRSDCGEGIPCYLGIAQVRDAE
jgi:hypothetical protein